MELNNVDLNKIAVFCQVVESGGYQRAAELLNVTPSALSQTMSRLEYSLGFPLFDRRGRRLIPTKQGLTLHREFRLHQGQFAKALKAIHGLKAQVDGTLRIGAYLEFAKAQLSPPLSEFIQEFPDARIKMVFDSPTRLQALLDQGLLDLCFSIFPAKEKKSLQSRALYQQELVLIAPPGRLSMTPTYDEILNTPLIDYYANHQPIRRWLNLHFNKRPKKVPVRIFAATAEMVLALVKEGAGIGIVPAYLVGKEVVVVRPTSAKLNDYIWMLESVGTERSTIHSVFRQRLLKHFGH